MGVAEVGAVAVGPRDTALQGGVVDEITAVVEHLFLLGAMRAPAGTIEPSPRVGESHGKCYQVLRGFTFRLERRLANGQFCRVRRDAVVDNLERTVQHPSSL